MRMTPMGIARKMLSSSFAAFGPSQTNSRCRWGIANRPASTSRSKLATLRLLIQMSPGFMPPPRLRDHAGTTKPAGYLR
jgi:hypothetical protein